MSLDSRILPAVADFLGQPGQLLIDGDFVEAASGKRLEVINPANERIIASVAEADVVDTNRAVKAARRAFDGVWSSTSAAERGRLIWKLADLVEQHAEQFAQLDSLDNGKPVVAARNGDVPIAVSVFRYYAGWSTKISGQTNAISWPGDWLGYTLREPIGVVGQIIPWNFPLVSAAWKIAPALATGNAVVLKSAEQTPLSAILLGKLILEAGFPPGVVNIITGLGENVGAALAAHPEVDKISFTGSTTVGHLILQAAAGNLKKVSLELGGKSPVVVFDDADLELTIPGVAQAIFANQGEVCTAGSRLYVHERVYDRVVEGVAEIARGIRLGDGLDEATEMGPLVSRQQLDRVAGYVDIGQSEGAELVAGGARFGDCGFFMQPTVFASGKRSMRIVQEEIFGPVVCAMPFKDGDVDAVVHEANDSPYGLAASVWTQNLGLAHKVARRLSAGSVWINCHTVIDPAQPFGGYKQSGWGRELGEEALHSYTEVKAVTAKL
ncbi:aldehyde dehydrogenase family protein [Pseudomonas aeruginosa]|uniref:aldehyde dehydrogenase family protein n=1 Tax=Pseudomonas aeruginosa TaxID=287 RepID=UPI0010682745|nr:aldehyde dehydrogenase family protein [Pseudomonas aeruginosa]TEO04721.1 aldehyde dehydrogenase family protein [Pseudomonas aeruginosa]TEO05541.1 aldehyde dehydrogenase family protein [Pseudomonas aeruginosa]TEO10234.1 aldehyde dehydrogenase family protein [Pseudomonas aeruginosa]